MTTPLPPPTTPRFLPRLAIHLKPGEAATEDLDPPYSGSTGGRQIYWMDWSGFYSRMGKKTGRQEGQADFLPPFFLTHLKPSLLLSANSIPFQSPSERFGKCPVLLHHLCCSSKRQGVNYPVHDT